MSRRKYRRKDAPNVRRRKRRSKCLPHQLQRLIPNLELVKEDLCLSRGSRDFMVWRWGDVSMSTVVVERCLQGRKDAVVNHFMYFNKICLSLELSCHGTCLYLYFI